MSRLAAQIERVALAKRAFAFWGDRNGKELVAARSMKNRRAAKIPL